MSIKGVIFDLDGVIVSTDEYHCQSWFKLAKDHDIYFDRKINDGLRGLGRYECIEIFLEKATRTYSESDKILMAEQKNRYYLDSLVNLGGQDILPGVMDLLSDLKTLPIKLAIGTSSKNCNIILEKIGLSDSFKIRVDGNQVSKGKPDPEIFLMAANLLGLSPKECVVIEDGEPGVTAALRAGMKVLGVGRAVAHGPSTLSIPDLTTISANELLSL